MNFYELKMFAILRKKNQKKSADPANHNDLQFIDIEVDNWSINGSFTHAIHSVRPQ